MTAAVIALSLAVLGTLVTVGILVRALLSGLRSERASFASEILAGKAQVAAELAQRFAERQRDESEAKAVKASAERDKANALLVGTQAALNKAREENAHATVVRIREAPSTVDALRELDQLFATLPEGATASVPGVPASDDHGQP